MQENLDRYISTNHQLEHRKLLEQKFLALLVELGELANETRCFKFWSTKKSSSRAVILEEYVDNIHFLLSIGLEKGYQFSNITYDEKTIDTTKQFNIVFQQCLHFYNEQTEKNYLAMIKAYLTLADILGFSEQDIFSAYIEKNEINYDRQKSGY